jgi:hypothetical protein
MNMQKRSSVHLSIMLLCGALILPNAAQAAASWRAADAAGYADMLIGGMENGQPQGVCRVEAHGGIHIGKLMPNRRCHIGWGGAEEEYPAQSILRASSSQTLQWRSYDPRYQRQYGWLQNGGYEQPSTASADAVSSQQEQYVCRILHQRAVHVGKLLAGTHACLIGWGGQEISSAKFDVLVEKTAPAYTPALPPLLVGQVETRPVTSKPQRIRDFPPYSSSVVPCVNGQPSIQSVSSTFSEGSLVVLTGACLSGSKKNGKLIFHFKGTSAPTGGYSFLQSQVLVWTDSRIEIKMLSFIANEKSGPIRIELVTGEGKSASTTSQFVKNK